MQDTNLNETTGQAVETPETGQNSTESAAGINMPTVEQLAGYGIKNDIAEAFVNGNYAGLKKALDIMVAEEAEKRITSFTPKTRQTDDFMQQLKTFESMGYKDRLELYNKNPRLYNELITKSLERGVL